MSNSAHKKLSRRERGQIAAEAINVFCPPGTNDPVCIEAVNIIILDYDNDPSFTLKKALSELSSPQRVKDRIQEAREVFTLKHSVDYRLTQLKAEMEAGFQRQNERFDAVESGHLNDLQKKLDDTLEKLEKAKKRAIKYFRIGLSTGLTGMTIGITGMAIGIATRFGYLDGLKSKLDPLFAPKQSSEQKIDLSSLPTTPSSSPATNMKTDGNIPSCSDDVTRKEPIAVC